MTSKQIQELSNQIAVLHKKLDALKKHQLDENDIKYIESNFDFVKAKTIIKLIQNGKNTMEDIITDPSEFTMNTDTLFMKDPFKFLMYCARVYRHNVPELLSKFKISETYFEKNCLIQSLIYEAIACDNVEFVRAIHEYSCTRKNMILSADGYRCFSIWLAIKFQSAQCLTYLINYLKHAPNLDRIHTYFVSFYKDSKDKFIVDEDLLNIIKKNKDKYYHYDNEYYVQVERMFSNAYLIYPW